MKLSTALQDIATLLDDELRRVAGEPLAFVLLVSADNVAQYVSNASRADGTDLIKSLLQRWEAGRADIPAHYNPDLKTRADSGWLPIESAPDGTEIIVARITDNRLMWAESGRRGKGALRSLFYSLHGHSIPGPTHYAALPPVLKAQQKGGV